MEHKVETFLFLLYREQWKFVMIIVQVNGYDGFLSLPKPYTWGVMIHSCNFIQMFFASHLFPFPKCVYVKVVIALNMGTTTIEIFSALLFIRLNKQYKIYYDNILWQKAILFYLTFLSQYIKKQKNNSLENTMFSRLSDWSDCPERV